jgi:hypothetical protein
MADWATISALATAGGTLALAGVTLASVRSANRAARVAERALLADLRPLLVPSRPEDPPQKIGFADGHWLSVPGGGGAAEVSDEAIYLAMPLRNVGTGLAVLHGWRFYPEWRGSEADHTAPEEFTRLTRDLYVPVSDVGFWQGSFRDPSSPEFVAAKQGIGERRRLTVEVLYGDQEGAQRLISRFALLPRERDDGWIAVAGRHWNLDRPDRQ